MAPVDHVVFDDQICQAFTLHVHSDLTLILF